MKIGIITWFTGSNYGTNLQAIALQHYLRKLGYEVKIINYEVFPSELTQEKKTIIKKILHQPKKYAIKFIMKKYELGIIERDKKLNDAILNNCILTKRISNQEQLIELCNSFDLLICGSDQIWNPNWYDRFYYADYDEIKTKRISFAPSMGVNSIPVNEIPEISRSVKKFDFISVRESRAADLLSPFLEQIPEVVVDPTLLLTKEDWTEIFPEGKKQKESYVFAFFLNDEYAHLRASKDFAKRHNCRLVIIPYKGITYIQNADIRASAGLEDLMDIIRNAKYILTDSFHITVFSIIYRKQFFTFQRFKENLFTSQNVRITNLLKLVNLSNRLIPYQSKDIQEIKDIIYENHIDKLNSEIEKSKLFLNRAIKNNNS